MPGYLRVSLQGSMPGGEVWSVNPIWRLSAEALPTYEELITLATAINSITVPAGMLAMLNSNTQVTGVRLEARSNTGALEAIYEADRPVPQTGSGASVHPFQTSVVLSLRTTSPGASGRGRLYWPATGVALTPSTMRVPNAALVAFRDAFSTYLGDLTTAIELTSPVAILAVWSRTLGTYSMVNRLSAGDVLDVQRRRRDTLAEAVVTGTYP